MKLESKKAPKVNEFAKQVGKAMKRAAKNARKIARMHGTTISYVRNGKIISEKP